MRRTQAKMGKAEPNTFILKCAINQSINAIKIFMHTRPNYRHVPVCIRVRVHYAHRIWLHAPNKNNNQNNTTTFSACSSQPANNGKGEGTRWPAQRQQGKFGESCQNCMRCELNEENQMVPNARMCPTWCRNGKEGCEVQIERRVFIWCHWFIWHNQISNYFELQSVAEMKIKLCTQTDYSKLNK